MSDQRVEALYTCIGGKWMRVPKREPTQEDLLASYLAAEICEVFDMGDGTGFCVYHDIGTDHSGDLVCDEFGKYKTAVDELFTLLSHDPGERPA